jgi:nicotinamide N-methyltransferase
MMPPTVDDDPLDGVFGLFQEPEGYYQPEKPATTTTHTLKSGEILTLRLVGHNPLWVYINPS